MQHLPYSIKVITISGIQGRYSAQGWQKLVGWWTIGMVFDKKPRSYMVAIRTFIMASCPTSTFP